MSVYRPTIDEGRRQIILLALFKLKREKPGFDFAIGEIEKQLGGQLDWPESSKDYRCLNCDGVGHFIADCPKKTGPPPVIIQAGPGGLPPARSIPTCRRCESDTHAESLCPFDE